MSGATDLIKPLNPIFLIDLHAAHKAGVSQSKGSVDNAWRKTLGEFGDFAPSAK